jgi:integrase
VVTVPLTDELRAVLDEWRQTLLRSQHRHVHTGWIFPSRVGQPHHNASCMRKAFIDCLNQLGLGRSFSSHGLRRTANNLLRQVASGEVTRAITGHVTVQMTEHYSHIGAGEKRAAVEKVLSLVMQPRPQPSARADAGTA